LKTALPSGKAQGYQNSSPCHTEDVTYETDDVEGGGYQSKLRPKTRHQRVLRWLDVLGTCGGLAGSL